MLLDWDRLDARKYRDEREAVAALLKSEPLPPAIRASVQKEAATLVAKARRLDRRAGMVESFLQQFSLSTPEGLALMGLAEALLRTPDADTRDRLIAEKISAADWAAHLGQSDSLLVNASTWGLMLTGRLIDVSGMDDASGTIRRLAARVGEPIVRAAVAIPGLTVVALAPNLRGARAAYEAGAHRISIPVSVSEGHSRANLNRAPMEQVAEVGRIIQWVRAQPRRMAVEAACSTAFGCSIDGVVAESAVLRVAEALAAHGPDTLALADTVGYANPAQVRSLVRATRAAVGKVFTGLHLHDTMGLGLANALAGLEEGVWPPNAPTDPFLSRPMRKSIGLPPPERRIGLSAHDFAQAACAGEVYLLHTERRAGQPSVKSRWLWRLETLARGAGVDLAARDEVVDWARRLDAPGPVSPAPRPAPTPPVADRPRKMAVTRIEALTRDPYAVWARDILKLFPLERPDEAVDVRARGTAIHEAFEKFTLAWPRDLPLDAADRFKALYLEELVAAGAPRSALAREQALANEAAAWIVEWEHRRRAGGTIVEVEKEGRLTFDTAAGPFVLTARTDRIELTRDGRAHILDYKTGKAPSEKMVRTGFSPQLTLTAAIVAHGVVDGVPPGTQPGELTYIEITGRKPAGREEVRVSASDWAPPPDSSTPTRGTAA